LWADSQPTLERGTTREGMCVFSCWCVWRSWLLNCL
jgi:hypothetical protein